MLVKSAQGSFKVLKECFKITFGGEKKSQSFS